MNDVFDGQNISPDFLVALKKFLATYGVTNTFPGNVTITGNLNVQGVYESNGANGVSGTITLAKLTVSGTTGSIGVHDGIVTSFTNPT